MKRSSDRILTTHVGSLIRPQALQEFLRSKQAGKPYDTAAYDACLKESVAEVAARLGQDAVASTNPYWAEHGLTFEDPDGFRVVLVPEDGPAAPSG